MPCHVAEYGSCGGGNWVLFSLWLRHLQATPYTNRLWWWCVTSHIFDFRCVSVPSTQRCVIQFVNFRFCRHIKSLPTICLFPINLLNFSIAQSMLIACLHDILSLSRDIFPLYHCYYMCLPTTVSPSLTPEVSLLRQLTIVEPIDRLPFRSVHRSVRMFIFRALPFCVVYNTPQSL